MRFGRHFREVEKNFGAIERSSAPLYADSNRPTEELPHLKNFDPKSREGRAYIEKMLADLPDEIFSNSEVDALPDVITSGSEDASLPDFFTSDDLK